MHLPLDSTAVAANTTADDCQELASNMKYAREYLKKAAVEAARARQLVMEDFPDRGDALQLKLDDQIVGINTEMQRIMDVCSRLDAMKSARTAAARALKDNAARRDLSIDDEPPLVVPDIASVYEHEVEAQVAEQQTQEGRHRYSQDTRKQFTSMWESLMDIIDPDNEDKDVDQYYGEAIITTTRQSYRCPITKQMLEEPVRAPCGHYFSREAILRTLDGACPVCRRPLEPRQLRAAPAMAEKARRWREREQRERARERATVATLD